MKYLTMISCVLILMVLGIIFYSVNEYNTETNHAGIDRQRARDLAQERNKAFLESLMEFDSSESLMNISYEPPEKQVTQKCLETSKVESEGLSSDGSWHVIISCEKKWGKDYATYRIFEDITGNDAILYNDRKLGTVR